MSEDTTTVAETPKAGPWWTHPAVQKPVLDISDEDMEGWDAYEEAGVVRHNLLCSASNDEPLLATFNLAAPEQADGDDSLPSLIGIDHAMKQLDALPADKRRELLFGWEHKPRHERYTREDVLETLRDDATMCVALHLRVCDPVAHRHVASTVQETLFQHVGNVQVLIRFGTDKNEALTALNDVAIKLSAEWDKLVTELPADVREPA